VLHKSFSSSKPERNADRIRHTFGETFNQNLSLSFEQDYNTPETQRQLEGRSSAEGAFYL